MTLGCSEQSAEAVDRQEIELAFEARNIANYEEGDGKLAAQGYDYCYGREPT